MKVAIVYDRVNKWGGAERVLLALHELFPDAPLYTSVHNAKAAKWAHKFTVIPSFLQSFPFARKHHEFFAPLMPIAFESFDFDEYDLVISVTSEAAKGILTKSHTKHICICLTPTRYLWSGYEEYFSNPILRFISSPIVAYLRNWDRAAAARPDTFVAISATVRDRVTKYYGRESKVIYPPSGLLVSSSRFTVNKRKDSSVADSEQRTVNSEQKSGYYLVVSRLSKLTAYKRVDIAIEAANRLKIPLVVVGTGRDMEYYRNMAQDTVKFVGNVSDAQLSEYYRNCSALIFPGEEDFGLVMVEAQSNGKPVIAYNAGGAKEIVRDGVTGILFEHQTSDSLIEVLKSFDISVYNKNDCIDNAKRFSFENFEKGIRTEVEKLVGL